jgi:CheY-like chemotaxis protein
VSDREAPRVDREIARALAEAITSALAETVSASAVAAARDAAQLLALPGLDRALATLDIHAGRRRPAELEPIVDRLRRLAARSVEAGDVSAFRASDDELGSLAGEIVNYTWSEPLSSDDTEPSVATLAVSQVFDDSVLRNDASILVARRSRVAVPVAAAMRAAIDWLAPDGSPPRPFTLHGEPAMLEVRIPEISERRLTAAHRVVAAVDGSLGPALDGPGWSLRVPTHVTRATYLMVTQGDIDIAIPWHSVLRLHLLPAGALVGGSRSLGYPVVAPLADPAVEAPEVPMLLLGHGLKRAYFMADRLIWRLIADPCPAEPPSPSAMLRGTVKTDEGETYWVLDVGRLLERIELPGAPGTDSPSRVHTLTSDDVEPLGGPIAPDEVIVEAPSGSAEPALAEPETSAPPAEAPHAEPAPEPVVAPTLRTIESPPEASASPPQPAPEPSPPAPVERPAVVQVLIAEDSLAARVFLSRLLAQHGIASEPVASAADLDRRIREGPWSVVFADVDLPDARGAEWLASVRDAAEALNPPARVVALVRDRGDLDVARQAGVPHTLLKPFGRETVAVLLSSLGLERSAT